MLVPTAAVYVGRGSSHSWTWLADLFESHGIMKVRFADNQQFLSLLRGGVQTAIVSGGDGFEMAHALGGEGFGELKDFIRRGGTYVGMCAGAYLPLPSGLEPFSEFNISTTRIENIDGSRARWSGASPRVAVMYGQCAVFHPVRGEVRLSFEGRTLSAPLYGGPVFEEPDADEVLSRYESFTERTEFQVDRARADRVVLGNPAIVRCGYGSGRLILLGPHLEHPGYPEANRAFLSVIGLKGTGADMGAQSVPLRHDALAHAVADLRVAALGLENRSFLVGEKLWDAGRVLELIAAVEKRTGHLSPSQRAIVARKVLRVRDGLRKSSGKEVLASDAAPAKLVELARDVTDRHFAALRSLR